MFEYVYFNIYHLWLQQTRVRCYLTLNILAPKNISKQQLCLLHKTNFSNMNDPQDIDQRQRELQGEYLDFLDDEVSSTFVCTISKLNDGL